MVKLPSAISCAAPTASDAPAVSPGVGSCGGWLQNPTEAKVVYPTISRVSTMFLVVQDFFHSMLVGNPTNKISGDYITWIIMVIQSYMVEWDLYIG